ncbi:MAG TPA: response regulator transcription factor [Bryobacteraceae bacterium]
MRSPRDLTNASDVIEPSMTSSGAGRGCVKVVIVEDHRMFREWLTQMLDRDSDCKVCGEADNIEDAMEVIREKQPDIVIVDITLRGGCGLDLINSLRTQGVEIPVLVLSMHDESLYAERVLRAGARGYISKSEASSTLSRAIRQVLAGEVYISEAMKARRLEESGRKSLAAGSGLQLLAEREMEVFQLIGRGHNGREIARLLHLGETTVDTYRTRIKEKLRVRSTAELYSRAARWIYERSQ